MTDLHETTRIFQSNMLIRTYAANSAVATKLKELKDTRDDLEKLFGQKVHPALFPELRKIEELEKEVERRTDSMYRYSNNLDQLNAGSVIDIP